MLRPPFAAGKRRNSGSTRTESPVVRERRHSACENGEADPISPGRFWGAGIPCSSPNTRGSPCGGRVRTVRLRNAPGDESPPAPAPVPTPRSTSILMILMALLLGLSVTNLAVFVGSVSRLSSEQRSLHATVEANALAVRDRLLLQPTSSDVEDLVQQAVEATMTSSMKSLHPMLEILAEKQTVLEEEVKALEKQVIQGITPLAKVLHDLLSHVQQLQRDEQDRQEDLTDHVNSFGVDVQERLFEVLLQIKDSRAAMAVQSEQINGSLSQAIKTLTATLAASLGDLQRLAAAAQTEAEARKGASPSAPSVRSAPVSASPLSTSDTSMSLQGEASRNSALPPPPSPPRMVKLLFAFPADSALGDLASLYWLSHNSTELLYSEIPAGMQAEEITLPGQCWRVRDAHNGNHLLTRYCATEQPVQQVMIRRRPSVVMEFRYPSTHLAAPFATIEKVSDSGGAMFMGTVAQGSAFSIRTDHGANFRIIEAGTQRLLLTAVAGAEAVQFVSIGVSARLEFVAPRRAAAELLVYRHWGGDEELQATLKAGEAKIVESHSGESWLVREGQNYRKLLSISATEHPYQRIYISNVSLTQTLALGPES